MAADKAILQDPTGAGKLPGSRLAGQPVAQWVFIGILVVLIGLSRTEGAIGTFLRLFSTFLLP